MRTAPLLIALFLLAGAAALAYVPTATSVIATATANTSPGSFPLGPSFQWPAKLRSAPFQPSKGIGSDALAPSPVVHDAKTRCLNECSAASSK